MFEISKDENLVLSILDEKTQSEYLALVERKTEIDLRLSEIKAEIMKKMDEQQIRQIKTPSLTISFIDEQLKETFNKDAFKKDNPKLYDEYVSFTKSPKTLRILVKKGGE